MTSSKKTKQILLIMMTIISTGRIINANSEFRKIALEIRKQRLTDLVKKTEEQLAKTISSPNTAANATTESLDNSNYLSLSSRSTDSAKEILKQKKESHKEKRANEFKEKKQLEEEKRQRFLQDPFADEFDNTQASIPIRKADRTSKKTTAEFHPKEAEFHPDVAKFHPEENTSTSPYTTRLFWTKAAATGLLAGLTLHNLIQSGHAEFSAGNGRIGFQSSK